MAGTFTLELSRFAEKTGKNFDKVVRKVILDIFSRIVMRTPVDTGRARGGWQIGRDLATGENVMLDKGGGSIISKGSSAVGGLDVTASVIGYIYNNVVYITVLEDGHSRQAPHGMVKVTLTEFEQFVAQAVASLG